MKITEWTGVAPQVATAARALMAGAGLPGIDAKIDAYSGILYSKRDYAAAGQAELKFFTETQLDKITNMPASGNIGDGNIFLASHLRTKIVVGIDRAGSNAGGKKQSDVTTDPIVAAEELRQILDQGWLTFKRGRKTVLEIGLDALPWGGGLDGPSSMSTGTTATLQASLLLGNGAPHLLNRFRFEPGPEPFVGGQQFGVDLNWPTSFVLTGGGYVQVQFDGVWVVPSGL